MKQNDNKQGLKQFVLSFCKEYQLSYVTNLRALLFSYAHSDSDTNLSGESKSAYLFTEKSIRMMKREREK